ncbi:MAG TPA: hypothetical protein VM388_00270 [Acidimicrobiales bacterium]|nr:hypothetical protein [Acidimicrobiales bacterium]
MIGSVLFLVGLFLLATVPGGGDVDAAQFQEFYVTDDGTATAILGMFVMTLGCLALLWFLWELRTSIGTPLAGLGFASGATGLALVVAGAALLEAPSGVQAFSDADFVGEQVAHAFAQAGWAAILVGGALFLGLAIAISSLAARQTGALPAWVTVAGFVVAALQLGAFIWLPSLAIPVWFLLAALTAGQRATGSAS